MKIERMTVRQLIALLQQYPDDLQVVVQSYEAGYDPVTDVGKLTITKTQNRAWYVGVYDKIDQPGGEALLISSKYNQTEIDVADTQ